MKRIRRIPIVLALGAITSIAMAWCASLQPENTFGHDYLLTRFGSTHSGGVRDTIGATMIFVAPSEASSQWAYERHWQAWIMLPAIAEVDHSCRTMYGDPPQTWPANRAHGFGWPLRCLWTRFEEVTTPQAFYLRVWANDPAIVVTPMPATPVENTTPPRVFAMRPLWLGLAGDIVVWALIWWVALTAPGAVHRVLRRRRGLCPSCGYDIRASKGGVCPECGSRI